MGGMLRIKRNLEESIKCGGSCWPGFQGGAGGSGQSSVAGEWAELYGWTWTHVGRRLRGCRCTAVGGEGHAGC